MKKKLLLSVCFLIVTGLCSSLSAEPLSPAPQTSTYASYNSCLRQYNMPFEKLYYLSLASVNSNKFEILEMQSRNGYILFQANDKEFLLSVMKRDNKTSFVKITPADNNYAFSVLIPQRIFSYIDLNLMLPVQEVK